MNLPEAMTCDECGHFFDPTDERAFKGGPRCPCCTMLTLHGNDAWAVWNDCQGVFTDTVRSRRAGAVEALAGESYGTVVPIRCYSEDEEAATFRHWREDEHEWGSSARRAHTKEQT